MNILNDMLIGSDYEKMKLELFGLHLLEPITFAGDLIICVTAFVMARKLNKLINNSLFFAYWRWFFIVFGLSFLGGGIGHLFFNYLGVPGKYFAWYTGIFSTLLVEVSFISIFPKQKIKTWLLRISAIKTISAVLLETYIFMHFDLENNPAIGLFVPTVNSALGLGLTFGGLATYYHFKINSSFKYFWISALVLIPSAIVQKYKINLSPLFDKNDFAHVLILISLFLYFKAIKGYSAYLISAKNKE